MGTEMGADAFGGEGCDDGILNIHEYDWPSATWGPPVDMEKRFIPTNIGSSAAMKRIPLITVWQLNSRYQPTGCKLVETVGEGVVVIRQPKEMCLQWSASGVCLEWGLGWRCRKIDSHSWSNPRLEVEDESLDCTCFAP